MATMVAVSLVTKITNHVSLVIKVAKVVMELHLLKHLILDHLLNGLDIMIPSQMDQRKIIATQLVFGQMRVLYQVTVLSHYLLQLQMHHQVVLVLHHSFKKMIIIVILSDQSQLKRERKVVVLMV